MWFLPSQTPWNDAFLLNIWSHDQCFFTVSQQQGVAQLTLWSNLPQSPLIYCHPPFPPLYIKESAIWLIHSQTLCCAFKNLISMRSLNCADSHDIGHTHFCLLFFFCFRYFAKCHKLTFSISSQVITSISTKHCTQHLCTLLTKTY